MQIAFIAPLSNAWNRMLKSLFKPFDIKKWFVLGFTAFLANLLDWGGGSSGENDSGYFDFGEILESPHNVMDWINNHPEWTTLIIFGVVFVIAIAILFTWLSSRGKFMFLDNVVNDRALVKKPWNDFRDISKSLFLWRLGFGLVGFFIIATYLYFIYTEIYDMYNQYASDNEMIIAGIRMGIFLVILSLALAYISLFLNDFVVPLMYKNNISVWIGWSHFMPMFTQHFVYFILYGIFILFLYILVAIVVGIFGLLTCCIGFLFLLIPYVGTVILLPIAVGFRALSIEFLQQFGPEYKIFPEKKADLENSGE